MNNLRIFNQELFNEYMKLENKEIYSCPNITSSNRFLKQIKRNPIMYIGKETNGWINDYKNFDFNTLTLNDIESYYDEFLIDYNTAKSVFWCFIKDCLNIEYKDIFKNVVWTNTLIVGNRYQKGTPNIDDKIIELSLKNLLFLYDYFKPSIVINVSGNSNPYLEITKEFLKQINSNIKNIPNKNNILINNNNIFWTYHPMWLNYNKKNDEIKKKIYTYYKNK